MQANIADNHVRNNDNVPERVLVTSQGFVGGMSRPRTLQSEPTLSGLKDGNRPDTSQEASGQIDHIVDHLAELRKQHVKGQHYDVFDRSTSESSSDYPISINTARPMHEVAVSSQISSNSLITQALSSLPRSSTIVKHAATVPLEAKEFPQPDAQHRKRFSFQPGDDSMLLSAPKELYVPGRKDVSQQTTKILVDAPTGTDITTVISKAIKDSLRFQDRASMLPTRLSKAELSSFSRVGSTSSIVTAVRHDSGHNSVASPARNESASPRQVTKPPVSMVPQSKENKENNGSDIGKGTEAIVAASRAFNHGSGKVGISAGLPPHLQADMQEHRVSAKKKARDQ